MPTLQIIISLLLVSLFYSLLATTVMEMVAGWLSMRGKHLQSTLKNMLASADERIYQAFRENPLFEQLAGRFFGKKSPPSYLDATAFHSILMKAISQQLEGKNLPDKIKAIPDAKLKEVLEQFLEDADYKMEAFNARIIEWYEQVMDRASGWYKKKIQRNLLLIGIGIAIAFNADTLTVYQHLVEAEASDPAYLTALTSLAEEVTANDEVNTENRAALYTRIDQVLRQLEGGPQADPLGIGWGGFDYRQLGLLGWLWKLMGWLITAVAISLGAPFWFDLLKKVINIRSAGKVPQLISKVRTYMYREGEHTGTQEPVG